MKMLTHILSRIGLLALLAVVMVPAPASAQATEELDRERMTQFARAHVAINAARDEFHGKVARVHDEEGRRRAREEVEAQIAEVLEAQEMTKEQYDDITLRISLDGELRTMFDEILAELAAETGDG